MNKPTHCAYCAYCAYRDAAGTLTIHSASTHRTQPICWTCAREALSYYANQPARASFTAWPNT